MAVLVMVVNVDHWSSPVDRGSSPMNCSNLYSRPGPETFSQDMYMLMVADTKPRLFLGPNSVVTPLPLSHAGVSGVGCGVGVGRRVGSSVGSCVGGLVLVGGGTHVGAPGESQGGGGQVGAVFEDPHGSIVGGGGQVGAVFEDPHGSIVGGGGQVGAVFENPHGSIVGGGGQVGAVFENPHGSIVGGGRQVGAVFENPHGSIVGGADKGSLMGRMGET